MLHGITASVDLPLPPLREIEGTVTGVAIEETYSNQLTISGGVPPYTWSIVSGALPDGLSLNASTGEISGVVPDTESTGAYSFTVEVEDAKGQTKQRAFSISVGTMVILLHMNGPNGGTTFTDETGKTWTPAGGAQTVTNVSALGGSEGAFDGTGDYITTPDHADFAMGSDDWTIDGFITLGANVAAGRFPAVIAQRQAATVNSAFEVQFWPGGVIGYTYPQNALFFGVRNNGAPGTIYHCGSGALTASTRHHFAATKKGLRIYLHIDGVFAGGADLPVGFSLNNSTQALSVASMDGGGAFSHFQGRIDELRWVRGFARWNENETFTPPNVESDYPA